MFKSYYTDCFLESKYYKEIKENYNVLFTFIGGSWLLKCATAESDFDITIVVSDEFEFKSDTTCYLRFNDKIKVHGYIIPISVFLNMRAKDKMVALLFYELANLSIDFLLELNDEASYSELLKIRNNLSLIGRQLLLTKYKSFIENIENISAMAVNENPNKLLYYFLYMSYEVFGKAINYEQIKQFKVAMRHRTLTKQLFFKVKNQILKLKTLWDN